MRSIIRYIAAPIVLVLLLFNLSQSMIFSTTENTSPSTAIDDLINRKRVSEIITEILRLINIDPISLSREQRYSYYLGGRSIRLCGETLERIGLVDLNSSDLVVGAFVRGSWIELPYRVFVDSIRSFNGYTQYIVSPIITRDSCLELVLPDTIPERSFFGESIPPQVRGSRSILLTLKLRDEFYDYEVPVYIYMKPVIKDPDRMIRYSYDYDPKNLGIVSAYRTQIKMPIIDLVIRERLVLERRLGLVGGSYNDFLWNLTRRIYEPVNREIVIASISVEPLGAVPDGGAVGISYNYVERRPVLFNRVISGSFPPVTITLTASNRSYSDNYYLIDEYTSWQLYNPYVTLFSVRLLVYGNDSVSRTLRMSIDGEQRTYTIYPNVINEIKFDKYYYEYPGRSVVNPIQYSVSIEPTIDLGKIWSLVGEVKIYYIVNTTAIKIYSRNSSFTADLFSVVPWQIVLSAYPDSNYNYTYKVSSIIRAPPGGYLADGTNMGSISQDSIDIPIRVIVSSDSPSSNWVANYTIKICLGGLLCGSEIIYLTKQYPSAYVTVRVKPVLWWSSGTPIYEWLRPYLISGEIPVAIEIIPNQLINIYPYNLYMTLSPYDTYKYSITFYFKDIATYKSPSTNSFQYTSLYRWMLCTRSYDTPLGGYYEPYSHLSLGTMHSYSNTRPNIYGSSSAYIELLRNPIDSFTGAALHVSISLGLPSIISKTDYGDESVQIRYGRFRVALESSGVSMSSASYNAEIYDPGPGGSLPKIEGLLSHISFVLSILSVGIPGLGALATVADLFSIGYNIFKISLSGDVKLVERTSNRIVIEYYTGSLYSTSSPLKINIFGMGLVADCPQMSVSVTIVVSYPRYAEVSKTIIISL